MAAAPVRIAVVGDQVGKSALLLRLFRELKALESTSSHSDAAEAGLATTTSPVQDEPFDFVDDPTVEDHYSKTMTVDGIEVQLRLLDTSGNDFYADLHEKWFSPVETDGYVILYSVAALSSFDVVPHFIERIARARALAASKPKDALDRTGFRPEKESKSKKISSFTRTKIKGGSGSDSRGKSSRNASPLDTVSASNWQAQIGHFPAVLCGTQCDVAEDVRSVTEKEGLSLAIRNNLEFLECSAKTGENVVDVFETIVRDVRAFATMRADGTKGSVQKGEAITRTDERKQGLLLRQRHGMVGKSWKKSYVVVGEAALYFFASAKEFEGGKAPSSTVSLLTATAKPVGDKKLDKLHCFELVSIHSSFILQCPDDNTRREWFDAIQSGIMRALETVNVAKSRAGTMSSHGTARVPLSLTSQWDALRQDVLNTQCADCSAPDPDWVSVNIGVLLCIQCSGIHRSMGVHVSKVRSLTLDRLDREVYDFLHASGNAVGAILWEGSLNVRKPQADDTRKVKERYLAKKYQERIYLAALPSNFNDANSALVQAIIDDDLKLAMLATAHHANFDFESVVPTGYQIDSDTPITPIQLCALMGRLQILVLLVQWGADVDATTEGLDKTALELAHELGFVEIERWLLKRGAMAAHLATAVLDSDDNGAEIVDRASLAAAIVAGGAGYDVFPTVSELDPTAGTSHAHKRSKSDSAAQTILLSEPQSFKQNVVMVDPVKGLIVLSAEEAQRKGVKTGDVPSADTLLHAENDPRERSNSSDRTLSGSKSTQEPFTTSEPHQFRRNTVLVDPVKGLVIVPKGHDVPIASGSTELGKVCSDYSIPADDVAKLAFLVLSESANVSSRLQRELLAEAQALTHAVGSTSPRAVAMLTALCDRASESLGAADPKDPALLLPLLRGTFSVLSPPPDNAMTLVRLADHWAHWFVETHDIEPAEHNDVAVLVLHILILSINAHDQPDIHIDPRARREVSLEEWFSLNANVRVERNFLEKVFWSVSESHIAYLSLGVLELLSKRHFSGWLIKQGGRRKNWRRRFLVLTHDLLFYFKDPKDDVPAGVIPLLGLTLHTNSELVMSTSKRRKFQFLLSPRSGGPLGNAAMPAKKLGAGGRHLATNHQEFAMCADSAEQLQAWEQVLDRVLQRLRFYEELEERNFILLKSRLEHPVT